MGKDKKQERNRGICRRIFAGFFLLMVACTIISRIYDSITVPKVVTAWIKEKTVETAVIGNGTVKEREVSFCGVYPGLRIEAVDVSPGKQVEEGQELFRYSPDSMAGKKEEMEQELKKLYLEKEKEIISAESYDQVTESELAAWELQMAERELTQARQEYEDSLKDHEEEMERLRQEYERKRTMTKEELQIQQEEQEEAARQELHSARNSEASALREALRKVEDLEEDLEELEKTEGEEGEIARKERELARAREDLAQLEEEWDDRIGDMEVQMDLIDDRNERIRKGETSSQIALLEAYEEAVRQQDRAIKEEEKKLDTFGKNVERARLDLETAAKRDQYARLSKEQKKRISQLVRQGIELDIRQKERELDELEKIMEEEGRVFSPLEGTAVEVELVAGKTSSGEERVMIASGNFWFEGEFEKEDQKLSMGDVIAIAIPGSNRKIQAEIEQINLLGEVMGVFRAELSGTEILLGTRTGYECRKESEKYQQVISLQGLRKDMKGYFCLVARPKNAILGEEFVAERVDVQVLYLGSTEAAVEGALLSSDEIIVGSNQVIGAGDRVRPVDQF